MVESHPSIRAQHMEEVPLAICQERPERPSMVVSWEVKDKGSLAWQHSKGLQEVLQCRSSHQNQHYS